MKSKKYNILILLTVVILTIGIIVLSRNILSKKNKEVKVAKEFIELLIDKEIIEADKKGVLEEKYLNQTIGKGLDMQYSVIIGKYAVDIDKDFNVIGFSNKNSDPENRKININDSEALNLAEKYLEKIYDGDFIFKEVRDKNEGNKSHYSVVFNKTKDRYPIYRQYITVVVDKYDGKMDSYININLNVNKYNDEINFTEEEANEIMIKYFNEIKKEVSEVSRGNLAYVEQNGEYILSYIFNLSSNESSNNIFSDKGDESSSEKKADSEPIKEDVIIRTDNGEFINLDGSLIKD